LEKKIEITGEVLTALNMQLGDTIFAEVFRNEKLGKIFPETNIIYHYTSIFGLISILESQSLFCTNINFLNDKREFKYGVSIIEEVIQKLKKENFENSILKIVEVRIDQIYKVERYVTCFSKQGDLLSQWRAYTNQGKGVSIGFDLHKIDSSLDKHISGKHIEYDQDLQLQVIEEIFRIIIVFFLERKDIFDWTNQNFDNHVSYVIIDFIQEIISSYKSDSFKEEQEYRFQYVIDGNMVKKEEVDIFFRSSDTLIIPYVKLETKYRKFLRDKENGEYESAGAYPTILLKNLPIKEIIIGPSLVYEDIKFGIEELLLKHNYENVRILKSDIPYRL
jgi:hypothetical protein